MSTSNPTPRPWAAGVAAARANLLPGTLLWLVGAAILLAWYTVPSARQLLQHVADLKLTYGYAYAAVATALFAGVFPFLLQWLVPSAGQRRDAAMFVFMVLFWAYKGIEVDLLYRAQAHVFGDTAGLAVISMKMVMDQFVYCGLWAVPSIVLAFQWAQSGFQWSVLRSPLDRNPLRWYRDEVVPVLLPNWCVWIPAVLMIYALPLPLQLSVQNLVACLWVSMLIFMTRRPAK